MMDFSILKNNLFLGPHNRIFMDNNHFLLTILCFYENNFSSLKRKNKQIDIDQTLNLKRIRNIY